MAKLVSETVALDELLAFLRGVHRSVDGKMGATTVQAVTKCIAIAKKLKDQVGQGYHKNPPLAIIGLNPPFGELDQLFYRNLGDGKLYEHPFGRGAMIYRLKDGGFLVRSKDGKPLWKDFK